MDRWLSTNCPLPFGRPHSDKNTLQQRKYVGVVWKMPSSVRTADSFLCIFIKYVRAPIYVQDICSYVASRRLSMIDYELRREVVQIHSKNTTSVTEVAQWGYWPLLFLLANVPFTMSALLCLDVASTKSNQVIRPISPYDDVSVTQIVLEWWEKFK